MPTADRSFRWMDLAQIQLPIGEYKINKVSPGDFEIARSWFQELIDAGQHQVSVNKDSDVSVFKLARGDDESSAVEKRSEIVEEPSTCTDKVSNFFNVLPCCLLILKILGRPLKKFDILLVHAGGSSTITDLSSSTKDSSSPLANLKILSNESLLTGSGCGPASIRSWNHLQELFGLQTGNPPSHFPKS